MSEMILVVKTSKLEKYIAGKTGLITEDYDKILEIITDEHEFIERDKAEIDPSFKQIIPYVAICRSDEVFMTRRKNAGGEARLHGKASLGVGGHINPVDGDDSALMNGLRREISEEVAYERELSLMPRGIINDDTNPVGAVHLGFFFTMEVEGEVSVLETEKLSGEFVKISNLEEYADNMETWSQIIMGELK